MSDLNLSGSCLCGSVAYEITGSSRAFYHCHCSRCRKASGTGHASNVLLQPETVRWIAGENLLKSYKVPEAKRFRNVFCGNCGSPMPRVAPDLSFAAIPAGSLDVDPGLRPQARIMGGSRTAWSCDGSELPAFDEYPPAAE
jgi:hypothetical protein